MQDPEYMRVQLKYFPMEIIKRYHLDILAHIDGYIYVKIKKGMYGLKQAAVLAYNNLSQLLKSTDYVPIINTSDLWKHTTHHTLFLLCVDNFGVNYYNKEDVQYLKQVIEKEYTVKIDWTGKNSYGYTLDWNYKWVYVNPSMTYINYNTSFKITCSTHPISVTKKLDKERRATICNARGKISLAFHSRHNVCPTHCGNIPVLCQST